jgi:uncharacterized protein
MPMQNNYEVAKKIADRNWDSISDGMPSDLEQKAESLIQDLKTSHSTLLEKLDKLYTYMDELYTYVAKFTPCQKGCSFCCYNEVSVSLLEAEYIEKHTGIKRSFNLDIKDFPGTPCPFLKYSACSIYKHRPFVCRRHVALSDDPGWCRYDVPTQYEFPHIRFSPVEQSYAFIIVSSGTTSTCDIRQAFSQK